MLFRLSFVALILAVGALGAPVKRDAAQLEADIKTLSDKVRALDKYINEFPETGGNSGQVVAIHMAVTDVETTIRDATQHADASAPFTDAEATSIIKLTTTDSVPAIKNALNSLETKKSALVAVGHGVGAMVEYGLTNLKENTDALGKAIWDKTPADQQEALQKEVIIIDVAMSAAIKAYST